MAKKTGNGCCKSDIVRLRDLIVKSRESFISAYRNGGENDPFNHVHFVVVPGSQNRVASVKLTIQL